MGEIAQRLRKRRLTLLRDPIPEEEENRIDEVRKRLLQLNTISRPPTEPSPALRAEMRATFAEDIERLGKLLDRDLGAWRCPHAWHSDFQGP